MKPLYSRRLVRIAPAAMLGALLVVGVSVTTWPAANAAVGGAAPQMQTDPAEVMDYYESRPDEWNRGPAEYIMLREEVDIWRTLETTEQRQRFIDWFWMRRDPDTRDNEHPFKQGFYQRVATANRRFRGMPRGWRSDRGRVWIIVGEPNNIRPDMATELEIWTYYTVGTGLGFASTMGEMHVFFDQVDPATWEIYGGVGPGAWPAYLLQAFDYVNRAIVANGDPHLEFVK